MSLSHLEIDHIGIAVESLESGRGFYEALGFEEMKVEDVASEQVRVGMFKLDNQAKIELLEATSKESPIAKFLTKKGPGIHHICLRVENIRQKIDELTAKGVQMIHSDPKPGANNCMIAFVHPKSTGGVLVELSQPITT